MPSEKCTDRYLQNEFVKVFGIEYETANSKLFKGRIPDGFYRFDNGLTFIMENKQ